MKKLYTTPCMKQEIAECSGILAQSGVSGSGIGYGGIDTGGDKEPGAKEFIWEEFDDAD